MSEQQAEVTSDYEPRIVAFLCKWCSSAGSDLAGVSRIQYPANATPIMVPCSGSISPLYILSAFNKGADGVLVSGCHIGDCHYIEGNYLARRKLQLVKEMLRIRRRRAEPLPHVLGVGCRGCEVFRGHQGLRRRRQAARTADAK